eukprot:GILJ01010828.1.p1 GENE.GILJ01010828.1~~GILJ01010828.1.p1  ORF type:complete len:577 (+),score=81.89 GILJ01010828.1:167-1732(+)
MDHHTLEPTQADFAAHAPAVPWLVVVVTALLTLHLWWSYKNRGDVGPSIEDVNKTTTAMLDCMHRRQVTELRHLRETFKNIDGAAAILDEVIEEATSERQALPEAIDAITNRSELRTEDMSSFAAKISQLGPDQLKSLAESLNHVYKQDLHGERKQLAEQLSCFGTISPSGSTKSLSLIQSSSYIESADELSSDFSALTHDGSEMDATLVPSQSNSNRPRISRPSFDSEEVLSELATRYRVSLNIGQSEAAQMAQREVHLQKKMMLKVVELSAGERKVHEKKRQTDRLIAEARRKLDLRMQDKQQRYQDKVNRFEREQFAAWQAQLWQRFQRSSWVVLTTFICVCCLLHPDKFSVVLSILKTGADGMLTVCCGPAVPQSMKSFNWVQPWTIVSSILFSFKTSSCRVTVILALVLSAILLGFQQRFFGYILKAFWIPICVFFSICFLCHEQLMMISAIVSTVVLLSSNYFVHFRVKRIRGFSAQHRALYFLLVEAVEIGLSVVLGWATQALVTRVSNQVIMS